MRKNYTLIFIFLCLSATLDAQIFTGQAVNSASKQSLQSRFTAYSLFRINTSAVRNYISAKSNASFSLDLVLPGVDNLQMQLVANDILAENYTLTVVSGTQKTVTGKPACITYEGLIANAAESRVRLTITDEVIYGIIRTKTKEYFIEPLQYLVPGEEAGVFAVYETNSVVADPSLVCGVTEMHTEAQRLTSPGTQSAGLNCVRTELAIASDNSMFVRYGSASAVQAHNIGVINNVMWDYVNAQFNNNVEFLIAGQNVSATPADDQTTPLYAGTNANTILPNFRAWGEAGNFGFTYDLASLWTTRNIDTDGAGGGSSVIGLAYVGVVCTPGRYQLLEDFTGSNPSGSGFSLRVLTSHETGHNFGANHDAGNTPFIMAPSVQNTKTWSAASITAIDTHVDSRTCLAQCSASGPTTPNFISTPNAVCAGGSVTFTDQTLGGPTSWAWSFSGGTPATSTLRNPTVSFATAGLKSISLTTNNGNGARVKSGFVQVSTPPATACTNAGTSTTNAGVLSFNLANINSITSGAAADGNKYLDYSCSQTTILSKSRTYTVNVEVGTTNPTNSFNLVNFYIDYNNNGDFTDAGETVYISPSCYIGGISFSFTTPANPPVLNTLLRARIVAGDCVTGVTACSNPTAGQVEDYGVFFSTVIPVNLLSFTGYRSGNENRLNWQTANEINTNSYTIERSLDGISYSVAGMRAARNAMQNDYTFTDYQNTVQSDSKYFYRLKITDSDGGFKYSNIVVIRAEDKSSDFSVFPNPVKRGSALQLQYDRSRGASLEILSVTGQLLYRNNPGNASGQIHLPDNVINKAGVYIFRLFTNEGSSSQKVTVY